MKRPLLLLFLAAGAASLWSPPARAQFISDDQDKGTYQNYSGRNYENYSTTLLRRKFYDNFGNFLVDGVSVFDLNEEQRPINNIYDLPLSTLTKTRFYFSYFSNLIILNDSYGGFTSRLMIGDAIRTKFTSLTLDKARFNGIRWDGSTNKYRGSIVASRESDPIRFAPEGTFNPQATIRTREWTDYLLGGHFETDIGDVLTIGATYINQHQQRSTQDSKTSSIKGAPANAVPRVIFVKISDDTPGDNSGPIVYGAPQIYLNGNAVPMIDITSKSPEPKYVGLGQPVQYWMLNNYYINYSALGATDRPDSSSFTQYKSYQNNYGFPGFVPRYPYAIPSTNLSVDQNVTYAFIIPAGTYSVDFSVVLANDFRIEANHDWVNAVDDYPVPGIASGFISHADTNLVFIGGAAPIPTIWRNMSRAPGNVKDGSNRQVVRFSYGLTTGMDVYGMNFKFNYAGFKIEGEYARSTEFFKYPISVERSMDYIPGGFQGDNRFESPGEAFFFRGTKKVGRVTFGAERYKMTPQFTTMFDHYTMDNTFYGNQNAPVMPDYLGFDQTAGSSTYAQGFLAGRAGGAVFSQVDDNDDNDRWEDGFYHYNVTPTPDIRNGDVMNWDYGINQPGWKGRNPNLVFKKGYRQNTNELTGLSDIIRRPDAGIFPGRDKDRDGIPDDDKNADGLPDYVQDFLTFYADPPFFNYGDDWNNNGVIDEQENDILPDYPYNPDIDGYHVFGIVEMMRNMNMRLGTIREQAMAYGGKNYSDYLRWTYEFGTPKYGNINLLYVYKRVKDNIPNNGYQFTKELTLLTPIPEYQFDPLEYRDSRVHQIFLGTVYSQVPNFRLENNIKLEFNSQFPIGLFRVNKNGVQENPEDQLEGSIEKRGLVHKAEYNLSLMNGRLHLIPQLKVRSQKVVENRHYTAASAFGRDSTTTKVTIHDQYIIPILRAEYKLTDRTDLHIGLQGIPGTRGVATFQYRNVRDYVDDEDRTTLAVSISNRSSYGGYNVVIDFGFKQTQRHFERRILASERDREESLIYMAVYAGF